MANELTPEELADIDPSLAIQTNKEDVTRANQSMLAAAGFYGDTPNLTYSDTTGRSGSTEVPEVDTTTPTPEATAVVSQDTPQSTQQINPEEPEVADPMDTEFNRNATVKQEALEEKVAKEAPNAFVRIGAGMTVFSPTLAAYDWATGTVFEEDPNFNVAEHIDYISQEVPPVYWETLLDAGSTAELEHQISKIGSEMQAIDTLFDGGLLSGYAYTAASILADPTSIVAGVAEIKALSALGKASRIQRGAVGAGVGGVVAAGQESLVAAERQTVTSDDVVVGTALGFGVGGLLGAAFKGGDELGQAGRLADEVADQRFGDGYAPDPGDDPTAYLDSVGAMRADTEETPLDLSVTESDFQAEAESWVSRNGSKLSEQLKTKTGATLKRLVDQGIGLDSTKFLTSKSEVAQWFGATFLENAAGLGGRTKTAAILKDRYQHQISSAILPMYRQSYKRWAKANGYTPYRAGYWSRGKDQFDLVLRQELEGRRLARNDAAISRDPAVVQAADAWQKGKRLELDLQKKHGVVGAEEIEDIPGYVQLKWKGNVLRGLAKEPRKLKQYQNALSRQYARYLDIDGDTANIMAGAVFQRAMRKDLQLDTNPAALVSADARGHLQELFEEAGISGSRLDGLMQRIDGAREARGKATSLRRRNEVDLFADDGGVRLIDLVDNNMDGLAARGAGETSGRVALAAKGVKSNADWESLRSMLLKDMAAKDTRMEPDAAAKLIDSIHAQMHSRPVGEGVDKNARRLMDLAGLSMLGQVGFAQLAEIGTLMSAVGLREVMNEIPHMRRMVQQVRQGDKFDDDLLGEMEGLIGDIGSDHILYRPEFRFDEVVPETGNRIGEGVDKILAAGQNALGYASGMNIVRAMEQRMAVKILATKVAKLATGRKVGKKLTEERLSDIGWGSDELASITKAMQLAEWDGNTLKKLNLEKWPPEVAEEFAVGMNRFTAQVVQKAHVGESMTWMHSTMGALLTQFRSFPIIAMEKQLARNTLHNDLQTYTTAMYGFGVAAGVAVMKVAVNSAGLTEKQIEERLEPSAIARQAFQYTGMAGLLPDGLSGMAALGILPADFAYGAGRAGTSRPINPSLQAIPAAGYAVDVANVVGGSIKSTELWGDYDWGKSDVSAWQGATILGNTVPMAVGFGLLKQAAE